MCWNKGRLCWKIAKLFYFCHLKNLARPENFGPYYVHCALVGYFTKMKFWGAQFHLCYQPTFSVLFPPLQKVLGTELRRKVDTVTISKDNNWSLPNNTEQIKQADSECQRHRTLDWVSAKPFMGPLERFQWRVKITYKTCAILSHKSPLSLCLSTSISKLAMLQQASLPRSGNPIFRQAHQITSRQYQP